MSERKPFKILEADGGLNMAVDDLRANIARNIARPLPQVQPHEENDQTVLILAGGPSLNDFADEITARRKAGAKVITVNGTYHWALDHGITPSAQIVMDGRRFNTRFVAPKLPGVKYLLASQCHPDLFDQVGEENVIIWHAESPDIGTDQFESHYMGRWYGIPGGSTVVLRALALLRMLGYRKFELYGFDSCLKGNDHHAYAQPENDGEPVVTLNVGDKPFHCEAWMVSQMEEFINMAPNLGSLYDLIVHGDGLIAQVIKTGAHNQPALSATSAMSAKSEPAISATN
jgi:hypothetical protein